MHQLFYQDVRVGTIDSTESDFSRNQGHFQIDPSLDSMPIGLHIQNFISSWIEVNSIDGERHWDYLTSHENKYIDLLHSDEWFLLDESGEILWISPPDFEKDGEISWVYNCVKIFKQ